MAKIPRYSGEAIASAMERLLPRGKIWDRALGSNLGQLIRAFAEPFTHVNDRAADLIEVEASPATTNELIDEWLFEVGLPDPCDPDIDQYADINQAIVDKLTATGGQSRAFFINEGIKRGYDVIGITEHAPFECGISQCGLAVGEKLDFWEINAPDSRYHWTVNFNIGEIEWARCGVAECGVTPFLNKTNWKREEEWFECVQSIYTPVYGECGNIECGVNHILDFELSPPANIADFNDQCGINHIFYTGYAKNYICFLKRNKPAHTILHLDFKGYEVT